MNDDTTEMKHPEELMELLSVFTGDSSYEKVIPKILERKKRRGDYYVYSKHRG